MGARDLRGERQLSNDKTPSPSDLTLWQWEGSQNARGWDCFHDAILHSWPGGKEGSSMSTRPLASVAPLETREFKHHRHLSMEAATAGTRPHAHVFLQRDRDRPWQLGGRQNPGPWVAGTSPEFCQEWACMGPQKGPRMLPRRRNGKIPWGNRALTGIPPVSNTVSISTAPWFQWGHLIPYHL